MCEAAELARGGVLGEVLIDLLGEVPGEVLACHLAVADAASDSQRAPPRVGEMLNVKCYICVLKNNTDICCNA